MHRVLKTLSQLLEASGLTFTADDIADLPAEASDFLVRQSVLAPTRTATHVVCDACGHDHVEEVLRVNDAEGAAFFRIRCPDAGWVAVPAERLKQWTVDVDRLAWQLSDSIGSSGAFAEAVEGIAWWLGGMDIGGVHYRLAWLMNCDNSATSALTRLAKQHPPARTIVVCGSNIVNEATRFAAALSLSTAFGMSRDRFRLEVDLVRAAVAAASTGGNAFRRRGDYWELSFDGQTILLRDTVGLSYIARLLIEPNRDIPAITLLAARAGVDPLVPTGSRGEILDEAARENYRRRYVDLQQELEAAEKNNDVGQIAKLQSEIEQLTNELARATGLGGRNRKHSDAERTRIAVTMAIHRSISGITQRHAAMGKHLSSAISTGIACRYAPDRKIEWRL